MYKETQEFNLPIIIDLNTGEGEYPLKEISALERNKVIGLWVTAPESVLPYVTESKTCPARDVFNSAYLNIKVGQTDIIKKLPLLHIEKANNFGRFYRLNLGAKVNLQNSSLYIANKTAIVANTAIQIHAIYELD